ncbi:head-tail connector protein [Zavarzinella formosa]|uniref:head-tail connector protein n=1 Tax=Zavarzinella formosa TaxID=360055 RepID=UPI00031C8C80|nr:head-tail connector protein [Zavarzinella formosa]
MKPRRTVTVVTNPASDPVTLAEAKAWLRIDTTDEDALLAQLISAATDTAEQHTRRSLITRTLRLTLDQTCNDLYRDLGEGVYDLPSTFLYGGLPRVIELPKGPVQSITSVTTFDPDNASAVYSPSNYTLNTDGTRLSLNQDAVWPGPLRPVGACEIVYTAGYGDSSAIPPSIKTAILMLVAHLYESRGACDGDMPAGCAAMLNKYRIMDGLLHG